MNRLRIRRAQSQYTHKHKNVKSKTAAQERLAWANSDIRIAPRLLTAPSVVNPPAAAHCRSKNWKSPVPGKLFKFQIALLPSPSPLHLQ